MQGLLPCFIFPSPSTVYPVPGENVKWKRCGWIDVWKLHACMRILMKAEILKQINETSVGSPSENEMLLEMNIGKLI